MYTSDYPISGAIVSWQVGLCRQEDVARAFDALGIGALTPPPRSEYECLRAAIAEVVPLRNKMIQRHRRQAEHGCEVVDIQRDTEVNNYVQKFNARVENGDVRLSLPPGVDNDHCGILAAQRTEVQKAFEKHKHLLTGGAIGAALVRAVACCRGIRLLDRGGQYWIPEDGIRWWDGLAKAIEEATVEGETRMGRFRVQMDQQAIEHITAVLAKRVMAEADKLLEKLSGDPDEEALEAHKQEATELRELVELYSEALGQGLEELKRVATTTEQAAVTAAMMGLAGHV